MENLKNKLIAKLIELENSKMNALSDEKILEITTEVMNIKRQIDPNDNRSQNELIRDELVKKKD